MEIVFQKKGAILFTQIDITTLEVDVVVNSANRALAGIGPDLPEKVGGVDGAIHRAAGIELYERCLKFPTVSHSARGGPVRCEPGNLKITDAYRLPCRYIFHAVAPKFFDGTQGEWEILRTLYQNIFREFMGLKLQKIALVPIGTRSFGFPKDQAATIALSEATRVVVDHELDIVFSLHNKEDLAKYHDVINRIRAEIE